MDKSRPKYEQNLVDWAKPYLTSNRKLRCIMDPRLGGQYSVKRANEMALLVSQCVSLQPRGRPKMPAIIETLESLRGLRDMAVTFGHWHTSPKSGRNNAVHYAKGRKDSRFGCKNSVVAAAPRIKSK